MPEGPELRLNSQFVNNVCRGREFTGKVVKSAVSKCCDVDFDSPRYSISSDARGKEMALVLQCLEDPGKRIRLLFRFGMSGKFKFNPASEIPKHAHLQFYTIEQPQSVLSFVDARRFGSWRVTEGWGEERGPDLVYEYEVFRSNVLENLEDTAFNKPLCEAMLNQKFFNGIGNYLRAEIVFRAGIPPFTCARKVLESMKERKSTKNEGPDFLQLCHDVPTEVLELKVGLGKASDMAVSMEDYWKFVAWMRCYENPEMNNMKDHNGRTMWFKGEAGPMAPKVKKSRVARRRRVPPSVVKKGEEEEGGKETHTVKEEPPDDTVEQPEKRKRKKHKRPRVDTDSKGSISDSKSGPQPPAKRRRTAKTDVACTPPLRRSTRIKNTYSTEVKATKTK